MSEKDELCGAPAAIGMVVLALLFGGVTLAIYPGYESLGNYTKDVLKKSNLTDWLQAIGAIVSALAVSVTLYLQHRDNKKISSEAEKNKLLLNRYESRAVLRFIKKNSVWWGAIVEFCDAINVVFKKIQTSDLESPNEVRNVMLEIVGLYDKYIIFKSYLIKADVLNEFEFHNNKYFSILEDFVSIIDIYLNFFENHISDFEEIKKSLSVSNNLNFDSAFCDDFSSETNKKYKSYIWFFIFNKLQIQDAVNYKEIICSFRRELNGTAIEDV